MITSNKINVVSTFNSTFTDLWHTQQTSYINSANKVDKKTMIYWKGLASFKMENKPQNAWSFGAKLLPLLDFFPVWLNSLHLFVLSLRKINDDNKYPNNRVMRIISIVVLISSKKYVTVELYFITYWTGLGLLAGFMWIMWLKIFVWQQWPKKSMAWENFHSWLRFDIFVPQGHYIWYKNCRHYVWWQYG